MHKISAQASREHGHREQAEQHRGAEFVTLALAADVAAVDVPVDPLADQRRQLAVPAIQDLGQFRAVLPPGTRHQQHAQRRLKLAAGPRGQRMRLVTRHPENIRQIGAIELMPEVQLDDLALAGIQAAQRRPHQVTKLRLLNVVAEISHIVCQLGRLIERRGPGVGPEPAVALVACHRIQPRPQPLGITQPRDLRCGDDEGVLNRVGRVGRLAKQGAAVGVQAPGILVVGCPEAGRVTVDDGVHNLAIEHAHTVGLRDDL